MNKKLKSAFRFAFFLGLGIFLVWFSIKDISVDELYKSFAQADYFWAALSGLFGLLSHFSRTLRWKMLLAPLNHKPSNFNVFSAVMIGYLANYAIPKLGEITRCTVLTRYEKIPFQEGFGTVITERIIDVLTLFVVLILTLIFQFDSFIGISKEYILTPLSIKLSSLAEKPMLLGTIIFVVIILAFFLFMKKSWIKNKVGGKLGGVLAGFLSGLKTISQLKNPYSFVFHSVFIWVMYYLGIYVCFFCFPETSHLGLKESLSILLCGTMGVIFTPGGLGAYHVIVRNVLTSLGIGLTIATAYPWIVWGTSFLVIIIPGAICLLLLPIINKEKIV